MFAKGIHTVLECLFNLFTIWNQVVLFGHEYQLVACKYKNSIFLACVKMLFLAAHYSLSNIHKLDKKAERIEFKLQAST